MSYIRNTSNPEKLYMWSNDKTVNIMMGSETVGTVPQSVFNGLIKRWVENHCDDCTYNKASISTDNKECKTKFTYKDINILMYDTTWFYIAVSNYEQLKKQELFHKKRNKK